MDIRSPSTYGAHTRPLDVQRIEADLIHDKDVTHIIAAEAEFASLFNDHDADTLIWLQLPTSSAAPKMTCTGTVFPTHWLLRYSSNVLRASGFEKFTQLLDNERYQKRKASDLMLSGLLGAEGPDLMRKIDYVLNIGPSTDYDLRSEHLEALTLPKGIVQYSMMTKLDGAHRVPVCVAGGHDDACRCFNMRIRGATFDEPGFWINGQMKPLNLHKDRVPASQPVDHEPDSATVGRLPASLRVDAKTDIDLPDFMEAPSAVEGDQISDENATGRARVAEALRTESNSSPSDPTPESPLPAIATTSAALPDGTFRCSIWDLPVAPEFLIDDYCEVRHVANVIRLLLAMAGRPLLLNSAARVYTIAGLSKLFGLKSSNDDYHSGSTPRTFANNGAFANRLRSVISDWFFTQNNTAIVDVLPEESFIMAWNVKLPVVARVAYRILVAERALQDAGTTTERQPRTYQGRQKTVFGRELSGLLDDDMETMLDHASEALIHRMSEAEKHAREISVPNNISSAPDPMADVDEYAPLEVFFNNGSSVISRLRATAKVLEEFVDRERLLLLSSTAGGANYDLDTKHYPVYTALAAIRRLLDKLSYVAQVCFVYESPRNGVLLSSYSNSVFQCLSLYVRQSLLHRNWFVHMYDELPDAKKRMTAVYWMMLTKHIEERLSAEFSHVSFSDLVGQVNISLSRAATFAVPVISESQCISFRTELLQRLKEIGVYVANPAVLSLHSLESFSGIDIRYCLFGRASGMFTKFYEQGRFVPEFELSMLAPSPHLLLGLSTEEFRFLPLWAGGDNDGTGAVFEAPLPTAQLGPISPGPAYHTGTTNASASNTGIDDILSMAGPPSISNDGDAAMSDVDTAPGGSVSGSFILVRHLDGLRLASEQAASRAASADGGASGRGDFARDSGSVITATNSTNSLSSHASRQVHDGHSSVTGAHPSIATPSVSSFDDLVVVESADAGRPAPPSTTPSESSSAAGREAVAVGDVEYEFEYDEELDGAYNYADEDAEDQEYYDDDDDNADARSDDTVMPDRAEVEQAMRQDVQMQQAQQQQ